MRKYLLLDALFEGGRMFIGAISVIYLLEHGLSIGDIATLKVIQSLTFILAEVPTGVLGDTIGRRFSLAASFVIGLLGFLLFFVGNTFPVFVLGEIFLAFSLCFWSGSFEAFCIDNLSLDGKEQQLSRFFHLNATINRVSVVLFGFLGGMLASYGLQWPFLAAGLIFVGALLWLQLGFPSDRGGVSPQRLRYAFRENIRVTFREGLLNPLLFGFFVFQIVLQAAIQPIFHFWQPLFSEVSAAVTSQQLGMVFSLYVISGAGLSALYAWLSARQWGNSPLVLVAPFLLFGASYALTGAASTLTTATLLFSCTHAFLAVMKSIFSARFNALIPSANRAGILSSLSLFSRFGSMASLQLVSLLVIGHGTLLGTLFTTYGVLSMILSVVALIVYLVHLSRSRSR